MPCLVKGSVRMLLLCILNDIGGVSEHVVCDVWCVMCGMWWMVYGIWCVLCDVWWMVCGGRCVMCGGWCVVFGVWYVMCGGWCVVFGVWYLSMWYVMCGGWCVVCGMILFDVMSHVELLRILSLLQFLVF